VLLAERKEGQLVSSSLKARALCRGGRRSYTHCRAASESSTSERDGRRMRVDECGRGGVGKRRRAKEPEGEVDGRER
jgi:hypothetical protein